MRTLRSTALPAAAAPGTLVSWIIGNATTGVVPGHPAGTPNRLLL